MVSSEVPAVQVIPLASERFLRQSDGARSTFHHEARSHHCENVRVSCLTAYSMRGSKFTVSARL